MLRITLEEKSDAAVLKLEGRLAGPWTVELDRLWNEKAPGIARKRFALDLRGLTFADAAGMRMLHDIYSQTGAALLTGTLWTQYLAEEVASARS